MSRQEFIREHNYNQCTFDGWIKKVVIGLPANLPTSRVLVPLHIDHSPTFEPQTSFDVKYPNDVSLLMSSLPSNEDLSRILAVFQ